MECEDLGYLLPARDMAQQALGLEKFGDFVVWPVWVIIVFKINYEGRS